MKKPAIPLIFFNSVNAANVESRKLKNFKSGLKLFLSIFAILSNISYSNLFSQHIEVSAGYGFYESLTTSVKFVSKFGSKFGLSAGYDNSIIFKGQYQSAMFDCQLPIFKKNYSGIDYRNSLEFNKYKHGPDHQYFLDFKIIYWHLVDDYYYWHCVSLLPSFGKNYQFNYHWSLSVDAGVMFNVVLHRGRLNYLNAGWPYKVMPNFRILLNYKLW